MGFFSSNKKQLIVDAEFGSFAALVSKQNSVIWKGTIRFLNNDIALFINGDNIALNDQEKATVHELLKSEPLIDIQVNATLKEQYENADKSFSKWGDHFKCISLTMSSDGFEISFEENETYYHFNIHFSNNEVSGVSIDS